MAMERKAGFQSAIATDAGDTAAGYLTPDRYNLAHTVSGVTSGGIPYFDSTTSEASSALLASGGIVIGGGAGAAPATDAGLTWKANGTAGEGLVSAAGTATTDVKSYSGTQTWNNAAVTFTAFKQNITDSASNAASLLMDLQVGAASKFSVKKTGMIVLPGSGTAASPQITLLSTSGGGIYSDGSNYGVAFSTSATGATAWVSTTSLRVGSGIGIGWGSGTDAISGLDLCMWRAGANAIRHNGTTSAATTTSRTEINKAVATIADNTATATFTVTVPNAAHSAMLKVTLVGSLGAGGAVGANEATGTISYDFAIARTAGVATVVTASTAYGSSTSAVAGAATITITAAASAVSGANSATQTFTVDVTIAKGSGSSDNHKCLCYGRLLNANATGVTIA